MAAIDFSTATTVVLAARSAGQALHIRHLSLSWDAEANVRIVGVDQDDNVRNISGNYNALETLTLDLGIGDVTIDGAQDERIEAHFSTAVTGGGLCLFTGA